MHNKSKTDPGFEMNNEIGYFRYIICKVFHIVESITSPVYSSFSLWAIITIFLQVYLFHFKLLSLPFLLQSPENFTLLTGTVSGRIKQLLEAVCTLEAVQGVILVCTELELHHVRILV